MTSARKRIALVRGPGLSVFELQSYEPLLDRYDLRAYGLAQHSVDTDTLKIPTEYLRWKDSISNRSVLNSYRSRIKGQRYFMPGLEKKLRGFDLVHSAEIGTTFSSQCARAKKTSKAPLIITSTENIRYPGFDDDDRRRNIEEVVSAADHYFALTPDARDVLLTEGVAPDRITVMPFGLDLERLTPGPASKQWQDRFAVTADQFVITYAGRLVREKGIYDLAATARLLGPNVRMLFVGNGPERKPLEEFLRRFDLEAIASVHAALPYGQIDQLYRLSSVVVLPSLPTFGVREQFGMTLAEAMACGIPVVATRCGSMPWVIGDAGLLADPGNSSSLAEALDKIRTSESLRRQLGSRGQALAKERYDKIRIADRIGKVFAKFV